MRHTASSFVNLAVVLEAEVVDAYRLPRKPAPTL